MQPPANHIAMMQIDCEVINTKLLHVPQDSIPPHVSQGPRADSNNASLQRNQSHDGHHFDNASSAQSSSASSQHYSHPRSLSYGKNEQRYAKPTYIQDHDFPRRLPAFSGSQHRYYHEDNLTNPIHGKKHWKRQRGSHRPT